MIQNRFNYSKLSTYLQCPLRYKYIYIEGLDKKYRIPKPYLSMGMSVHKALYYFFKTPKDQRTLDVLKNLLRKYWIRQDFSSSDEERDFGYRAIDMLTDFYKKEDISKEPDYLERFFTVKIDGYMLSGKVDRIDRLGAENGYEIIDYKTGNYLMSPEEMYKDLQLPLYYFAVEKEFDISIKKITFLYLTAMKRVSIDTEKLNKDEIKKKVIAIINEIAADEKLSPKENIFCSYCEFSVICPLKGTSPDVIEKKYDNIIANLYLLNQASKVLNLNVTNEAKLITTIRDVFTEMLQFRNGFVLLLDESQKVDDEFSEIFQKALKSKHSEYSQEKSLMAIPLVFKGDIIAVVLLSQSKGEHLKIGDNIFTMANTLAGSTAIALKNAELYEIAIKDTLTNLYTRRFVLLRLSEEIEKAMRYKLHFSIIMFDLDRFKRINDTYGHSSGDVVLKKFGSLILKNIRKVDIAGRLGGEEFLVILPMTTAEQAFVVAERIKAEFSRESFNFQNKDGKTEGIFSTVSGGLAEYKNQELSVLLDESDKALYFSKDSGRNSNTIYNVNLWNKMMDKIKGV